MTEQPLLQAEGVAKSFGAVQALTDAALRVRAGEIVALMGANGAGKSTLVKILTGAVRPDRGEVRIRGQVQRVGSPAEALTSGLVPVYQEPSLIPDLDVADNLRLSGTPLEPFRHWVQELGIPDLRLDDPTGQLPLATLRILDLARALALEPDVLLLDEMTAALPTDLVQNVLRVMQEQKASQRGVIFISHRFLEIAAICDRATVLRDGRRVGDLEITEGAEDRIVELMLGARIEQSLPDLAAQAPRGPVRLRAQSLAAGAKLRDVSFELHSGEVLGVVALEGQGQDELFDVLAGFAQPSAGTLEVDGQPAVFRHPADAIAAGLSLVPGNRADALLMQRSVRENIALPHSAAPRHWGIIDMKDEKARVGAAIDTLQIDTRAQGEVQRLSGGNQQKVTIARWIAEGVETLLCFDPTRGIDVRTKRQIYQLVRDLAGNGAAVLLYTSELAEVQLACDRAVVIFNGRVVNVIEAAEADEPTLLRAAYGLSRTEVPA